MLPTVIDFGRVERRRARLPRRKLYLPERGILALALSSGVRSAGSAVSTGKYRCTKRRTVTGCAFVAHRA